MAQRTKQSKNNAALAEEFDVLKTRKGWTLNQLGERAGIDPAQVGRLLRNQATFKLDEIIDLASAFDESPAVIFDRALAQVKGK